MPPAHVHVVTGLKGHVGHSVITSYDGLTVCCFKDNSLCLSRLQNGEGLIETTGRMNGALRRLRHGRARRSQWESGGGIISDRAGERGEQGQRVASGSSQSLISPNFPVRWARYVNGNASDKEGAVECAKKFKSKSSFGGLRPGVSAPLLEPAGYETVRKFVAARKYMICLVISQPVLSSPPSDPSQGSVQFPFHLVISGFFQTFQLPVHVSPSHHRENPRSISNILSTRLASTLTFDLFSRPSPPNLGQEPLPRLSAFPTTDPAAQPPRHGAKRLTKFDKERKERTRLDQTYCSSSSSPHLLQSLRFPTFLAPAHDTCVAAIDLLTYRDARIPSAPPAHSGGKKSLVQQVQFRLHRKRPLLIGDLPAIRQQDAPQSNRVCSAQQQLYVTLFMAIIGRSLPLQLANPSLSLSLHVLIHPPRFLSINSNRRPLQLVLLFPQKIATRAFALTTVSNFTEPLSLLLPGPLLLKATTSSASSFAQYLSDLHIAVATAIVGNSEHTRSVLSNRATRHLGFNPCRAAAVCRVFDKQTPNIAFPRSLSIFDERRRTMPIPEPYLPDFGLDLAPRYRGAAVSGLPTV
ncbi:hypothetical protein SODALDRAFT_358440 [Sodiomyces alkalinus F11]|uniref:Uncharacterized protein n=1 Tax=Sodiomyces alkalinus (strain CBS 110278 / VKM F-3762 / F11) TaxID=1314773 RepID=A0A3N2Q076_SODAK|nr:hypothetical protein SODALDRAFT_358440 [Sodiomyces alkalinus F11]ROT40015.1 hypothetical protein SODALDRAFT_358440 [Sodiomyces alkalinus F11]